MVLVGRFIVSAFRLTSQGGKGRLPTSNRYFLGVAIDLVTLKGVFLLRDVYGFYVSRIGVKGDYLAGGNRRLFNLFAANVYNGRLIRNIYVIYSYLTFASALVLRS